MYLEPKDFLRLVEQARTIAFLDIEATGLRGDYNSILCISIKPYKENPITFRIQQPGNDKRIVREAKDFLEKLDCWVTYYGKGFDVPMLNTRLIKWGYEPIAKRPHIDMYYTGKANLLTSRRSQGHLLNWLEAPEQKMSVSADIWNQVIYDTEKAMKKLIERCESDVIGLEGLYEKLKVIIKEIKK